MKKKYGMFRLWMVILVVALVTSGCLAEPEPSGKPSSEPAATSSKSVTIDQTISKSPETDSDSTISEMVSLSYKVDRVKEQSKNVQFQIPQLSGDIGQPIFDQVNAHIRSELFAMAGLTQITSLVNADLANIPDDLTFESDFRMVLQKPEALSMRLSAYLYMTGAAHPSNLVRTLTFDLSNGKKVRASDCVEPGKALVQAIRNEQVPDGPDKDVMVEAVRYVNESMDDAALEQTIKVMDMDQYGPTSYWTDGKFGLNFETMHALGDFVQMEIPLEVIRGSVKSDPVVCQVLTGAK